MERDPQGRSAFVLAAPAGVLRAGLAVALGPVDLGVVGGGVGRYVVAEARSTSGDAARSTSGSFGGTGALLVRVRTRAGTVALEGGVESGSLTGPVYGTLGGVYGALGWTFGL
jgi:hypothetical protein